MDIKKNVPVTIKDFIINFLVSLTALLITYPWMFPVFLSLYSYTNGSIILNHTEGKNVINIETAYPWGR